MASRVGVRIRVRFRVRVRVRVRVRSASGYNMLGKKTLTVGMPTRAGG